MLERRGIPRIQPDKPRSPSAAVAAPKSDANLPYGRGGERKVRFVGGRVREFTSHPKTPGTRTVLYSESRYYHRNFPGDSSRFLLPGAIPV